MKPAFFAAQKRAADSAASICVRPAAMRVRQAGAIIADGKGTDAERMAAMEAAGIHQSLFWRRRELEEEIGYQAGKPGQ
jgi:succinyl-CoA synthetase alpha subunit